MLRLLYGLYNPCRGLVKINRQNLTKVTTVSLREHIYSAVGLIDPMDVDDEKLSSGELQKLAIARALVRNLTIPLLDESMSALDNISQQEIRHMLRKVTSGRTTFIVVHQLMTIQHVDIILVFEKGQIVQQDTHEELVRSEGLYRQLWVAEHGSI
jgi:ABC-type multidrug transport system fused ATPase/permease subunit